MSFLRGWNFVVDLYRILEHAAERLRAKTTYTNEDPARHVTALFSLKTGPSSAEVLGLVKDLYDKLPQVFKGAKAMTGILKKDRYGFQGEWKASDPSWLMFGLAANIIVTLQTVKMVMAGTEDSGVEQRCAIAGELLDALATVPTAYIQAISSPMVCRAITALLTVTDVVYQATPPRRRRSSPRQRHTKPTLPMVIPPSPERPPRHGRSLIWPRISTLLHPWYRFQAQITRLPDRSLYDRGGCRALAEEPDLP